MADCAFFLQKKGPKPAANEAAGGMDGSGKESAPLGENGETHKERAEWEKRTGGRQGTGIFQCAF